MIKLSRYKVYKITEQVLFYFKLPPVSVSISKRFFTSPYFRDIDGWYCLWGEQPLIVVKDGDLDVLLHELSHHMQVFLYKDKHPNHSKNFQLAKRRIKCYINISA